MRKSWKLSLGAVAFAAPIVLGFAYTAGASLGSGFGSHNIDTVIVEEDDGSRFFVDREETNGVVVITVSDSNGDAVAEAEYRGAVAAAVEEFGSDWQPVEIDVFHLVDGVACFDEAVLAEQIAGGTGWGSTESSPEGTFALDVQPDGTRDTAYFDTLIEDSVLEAQLESGEPYSALAGAQPLEACS